MLESPKSMRVLLVILLVVSCCVSWGGSYQLKPIGGGLLKNPYGGVISYGTTGSVYSKIQQMPWAYGGGYSSAYWSEGSCTGEITAVFKYVPDTLINGMPDPEDKPPVKVVVRESCFATVTADYGDSLNVYSNNGLGFPEQINYYGTKVTSTSNGVRWKIVNGGEEVTLTCEPSAIAAGFLQGSSAYVVYSASIATPMIKWDGVTPFPNGVRKFITGQKVKASIVFDTGSNYPDREPNSYEWSIPEEGMPFKDFIYSTDGGVKQDLEDSDVVNSAFSFYTVDNGDITVNCSFDIKVPAGDLLEGSPKLEIKSRKISSVRPTAEGWNVTNGQVYISGTNVGFFGPGQSWSGPQFTIQDFPTEGEGCFIQIITPNRKMTRVLLPGSPQGTPTEFVKAIGNGEPGLDAGVPYPFYGSWILPNTKNGVDSPTQSLASTYGRPQDEPVGPNFPWENDGWEAGLIKSSAHDTFKTWLMFKPISNGVGTTWMPIQMYTWKWNVDCARLSVQAQWRMDRGVSGLDAQPAESTEHPTWNLFHPSPFGMKPKEN